MVSTPSRFQKGGRGRKGLVSEVPRSVPKVKVHRRGLLVWSKYVKEGVVRPLKSCESELRPSVQLRLVVYPRGVFGGRGGRREVLPKPRSHVLRVSMQGSSPLSRRSSDPPRRVERRRVPSMTKTSKDGWKRLGKRTDSSPTYPRESDSV